MEIRLNTIQGRVDNGFYSLAAKDDVSYLISEIGSYKRQLADILESLDRVVGSLGHEPMEPAMAVEQIWGHILQFPVERVCG